jgi:ABC-type arginine transport system ATPase subunit
VLLHESKASELGVRIGDVYLARRDDVEIPVRVTGLWAAANTALPIWDFKAEKMLLVPEATYLKRIAPTVTDELYNSMWLLQMSGSQLQADEPTGELDSTTAREILTLFRRIVKDQNVTLLMVTHDPLVDEYADRVLLLKDGQIVA